MVTMKFNNVAPEIDGLSLPVTSGSDTHGFGNAGQVLMSDGDKVYWSDLVTNLANEVLELQRRFEVLSKEYAIYNNVSDSNGLGIEDSDNNGINGRIIYCIKQ